MTDADIGTLRNELNGIRQEAESFFDYLAGVLHSKDAERLCGDELWSFLIPSDQEFADLLRRKFSKLAGVAAQPLAGSVLIDKSDLDQFRHSVNRIRAALRFRRYDHWSSGVLHHEDTPLGVHPAGHSDDAPLTLGEGKATILDAFEAIDEFFDLVEPRTGQFVLADAPPMVIEEPILVLKKPKKRKRGPRPDTDNHIRTAAIVARYANWKHDEDVLDTLCEVLDDEKIPIPEKWGKWNPKPHLWKRAVEYKPRLVVQALEYRVKITEPPPK